MIDHYSTVMQYCIMVLIDFTIQSTHTIYTAFLNS